MKVEIGFKSDYRDKSGKVVSGYCFGAELTGSTIVNIDTGAESPGIRFRIREEKTGREFWTTTFPSLEENP